MLTLKEPIKLNCINDILTVPQEMNEKILANYNIMAAQFGAEDLLFFLGSEMGLPEDLGMTTAIAVENDNKVTQKLDIEVINNVVNRVLLGENTSFTYQDEVYISMVLQKMGIRDVKLFMSEAHTLIEENKNIYELFKIYKENSEVLTKVTNLKDEITKNKVEDNGEKVDGRTPEAHPYYIHNEIYSRLETNKIYHMVKEFQKNSFGEWRKFSSNELKIAEQCRVSNLLSLSEQKQSINSNSSILLTHHTNVFETGLGEADLATQQQVLERANAAMLINTIDNVLVSRLPQMENKSHYWLNVENAVNKLAENTLYRFQIYHQENSVAQKNIRNSSDELNLFFQEEKNVLSQLFQEIRNDDEIVKSFETRNNFEASKFLVNHLDFVQKNDATEIINTEGNESKISISNTELTDLTKQVLLNQFVQGEKKAGEKTTEKAGKNNTLTYPSIEEILSSNSTQYFETEKQIEKVETYFPEEQKEVADLKSETPSSHTVIGEKEVSTKETEQTGKKKMLVDLPEEERLLLRSMPYLETVKQLEKMEMFFAEGQKEGADLKSETPSSHTVLGEKEVSAKETEQTEKKKMLVNLPEEERLLLRSMPYLETVNQLEKMEMFFAEGQKEVVDLREQTPSSHTVIGEKGVRAKETEQTEKRKMLVNLPEEERLLLRSMPYLETVKQLEKMEIFFAEGKSIVSEKEVKDNLEVVINNNLISRDMKNNILNRYEILQQRQLREITNRQELIHQNIELTAEHTDETNVNFLGDIIHNGKLDIQEVNDINQSKMQFYNQNNQEQNNENNVSENFITKKEGGTSLIEEVSQISNHAEINQPQINLLNKEISEFNQYSRESIDKSQTENNKVISNHQQQFIHKTETLENGSDDIFKEQGATNEKPEDLKKQLDDINYRNKMIYETIQKNIVTETKHIQNMPDRGKIMDNALKSMDNPQMAMEELLKTKETAPKETATAAPMVNAILSQADDVTRKIYETVIAYEKNPKEALENGMIKQVGASAFNMDIQNFQQESKLQFTHTHVERDFEEKVIDAKNTNFFNNISEISPQVESVSQPKAYPKQQFVHKHTESLISDELIESLERQRTQQHNKIESNETITNESVKKTEVHNISNEVVNKNMQDITEVINRTLARQIGDISEKVFSQMERKLQMERARRGRF